MNDNTFDFAQPGVHHFKTVVLKEYPEVRGLSIQVWEMTPEEGGKTHTHVVVFGTQNGWEDIVVMGGRGGPLTETALSLAAELHKVLDVCDGEWPSLDFGPGEMLQ